MSGKTNPTGISLPDKLLRGYFSLEDTLNLTLEDLCLLADIDADEMQPLPPDAERTPEQQAFEQSILTRLYARIAED